MRFLVLAFPDIGRLLSEFAKWLLDKLEYIPKWIWKHLLDGLAALIEALPVPEAFNAWANNVAAVGSGVGWWLDTFAVGQGLALIMGAYIARFLLRRVPFIG